MQKGIEKDSHKPLSLYQIGDILLLRGKLEQAEVYLSRALGLDPETIEALLAMAGVCSLKRDCEESVKHLKAAAKLRPNDPQFHFRL